MRDRGDAGRGQERRGRRIASLQGGADADIGPNRLGPSKESKYYWVGARCGACVVTLLVGASAAPGATRVAELGQSFLNTAIVEVGHGAGSGR